MRLFGIEFNKKSKSGGGDSFVPPTNDDAAIEISDCGTIAANHVYGFDLDSTPTNEIELLSTYRELALDLDVDDAIQEICNDAIVSDSNGRMVDINLEFLEVGENVKKKIRDEFDNVLRLLNFDRDGYDIFRKWYVDGKIYYHKVIDDNNKNRGITELRRIEPEHLKLVREVPKKIKDGVAFYDNANIEEYYIYIPPEKNMQSDTGLKIRVDAIASSNSGLLSPDRKTMLSYLHKVIKPYNNLKLMTDSLVVYRVARAPERRVFYVDTGNLPRGKAEQYMKDMMNRYKNKIVYDATTGSITNRKKFQSMMEDYWMPRKEGSRGTEIETLPGASNLNELGDVEIFQKKLYKSLNVPISRLNGEGTMFSLGRTAEITREEIKFNRFVNRLRSKFAELFDDILRTQIILKRVITPEDWDEWGHLIKYDFMVDSFFQEMKEVEILRERIDTIQQLQNTEIIGKYISHDTVRKELLKQTESEIEDEDKLIESEKSKYNNEEQD